MRRRASGPGGVLVARRRDGAVAARGRAPNPGNRATGMVLQRKKYEPTEEDMATYFPTKVSMAVASLNYRGKCDAAFDDVRVERHWEWGLLADDLAIVFRCGPQRFRFVTSRTGGKNFPWRMINAKGGSGGWLVDPVQGAMETIYHHWTDNSKFQPAARVVIDALQFDVETYCRLEAEYRRKKLAEGGGIGAMIGNLVTGSR